MKSSTTLAALMAHCRKLTRTKRVPDAELLRRVAGQSDNAAFEELLERYAPLVWGVCRRIVSSEADCEDAFQAVFLTLFRRAGAVDPERPLGAWLHGVAVHAAHKAAAQSARQTPLATLPEKATSGDIAEELGNQELFCVVDEEIARLPALLREPFVLCCLEGRTRDEAAAALHCSVAAVKSRLERSRTLLRKRLERRGFGLPSAYLALGLTGEHVQASLRAKTLQCVFGSVPSAVAALVPAAGGSLVSKLSLTAISLVMVGALGFGAFHVMQTRPSQETPAKAKDVAPQSPGAEKDQPRLDRFGDPLPPGAIRRFGTLRWRHDSPILDLAFTPDGKQLVAGLGSKPLAVFDVATGRRLRTIGNSTGGNHYGFALSPDGKRVVCSVMGTQWDLQTGKLIRQLHNGGGQWASVAYSPDGKIVAAAEEHQVRIILVEAETGKQLVDKTLKPGQSWPPQNELDGLVFSPNGKYLAARFSEMKVEKKDGMVRSVMPASSQLWLLDAAKGTLVRTIKVSEDPYFGYAFQPGTERLATTDKDGTIRFWDVNTGKEVHRIAAGNKEESWGILGFLAGGRQCVLWARPGKSDPEELLTVVDVKDGKELRHTKLNGNVGHIVLSPDGRTAATAKFFGESGVRLWDVESGTERSRDAGHRKPATLSLSGDGQTLISRDDAGQVIHWDLRTGNGQGRTERSKKEAGRPPQPSEEWTLSGPRWRLIFHHKTSEMEVRSSDGSKLLRKVKWPSADMEGTILSPDGTHLTVPIHDAKYNSALLWNPEREDEPHQLVGPPTSRTFNCSQTLLFTHDSKRLFFGRVTYNPSPPNFFWVWDVATAKVVCKLPIQLGPDHLILSSNDHLLITGCRWRDPTVRIWDMDTGKERTKLTDPMLPRMEPGEDEWDRYVSSLLLSADERFLAVVTNRGDSSGITIWDTAAWKPVRTFPWTRVQNHPHSILFSRDGRSLFISNSDTTILEWDVSGRAASGRRGPAVKTPNRDRLKALWQKLVETPDEAYPAVWEMLDHPAESVPFLSGKLAPVEPIEETRVRRLIFRLDSEDFEERQQASRQLLALGEQTLPLLRQALEKGPALEAKKRIEGIMESLSGVPSSDQLRLLRAVAVLEWSNRPEAIEHLRKLAGGAPTASLTRAAKAALRRLAK